MTIPSTEDRVQFNVQNVYEYCRRHAKEQGWNDLRSFQVAMPSFPKCELSFDFAAPSGEQCPLRVTTTVLSRGEVKDFFGSSPVSDGGFVIKGAYQGKDRVIDRSPERSAELLAKGREFVADPAIGLFLGQQLTCLIHIKGVPCEHGGGASS